MRHLIDLLDLAADEINHLLDEAARLKAARQRGEHTPVLPGRVLGMIFEKPSLRTRVSFETAMAQLGGASVFQGGKESHRVQSGDRSLLRRLRQERPGVRQRSREGFRLRRA